MLKLRQAKQDMGGEQMARLHQEVVTMLRQKLDAKRLRTIFKSGRADARKARDVVREVAADLEKIVQRMPDQSINPLVKNYKAAIQDIRFIADEFAAKGVRSFKFLNLTPKSQDIITRFLKLGLLFNSPEMTRDLQIMSWMLGVPKRTVQEMIYTAGDQVLDGVQAETDLLRQQVQGDILACEKKKRPA